MLQYKNTPLRGCIESPADIVFGRPVQDSLPMVPQEGWRRINDGREIGMARLKVDRKETYDMNKSDMEPLNNGDVVIIQNMTGPHHTKWMPTGTVIESTGHRQYRVKVDGSSRLLLRNRKNLKKIKPIMESKTLKSRVIMPSQELLPQHRSRRCTSPWPPRPQASVLLQPRSHPQHKPRGKRPGLRRGRITGRTPCRPSRPPAGRRPVE